MKKVIVLAAAIALLAAPAFAGIRNTKHDLSLSNGNAAYVGSDNLDEICVFCHTPHGGQTGGNAPLWNRSATPDLSGWGDAELYNSVSLENGSQPSQVAANVAASDAPLCLSCHDSTNLEGGLINPPNVLAGNPVTWDNGAAAMSAAANLVNLNNDHPIGMNYSTVQGTDGELNAPSSGDNINASGSVKTYAGIMWCSSCHDVHDNTDTPFLATSNAGSALCLTCHAK